MTSTPVFANSKAHNFTFSSFTAHYYLSKDSSGISQLKIQEELIAEFPNFDQNHGIVRTLPFTNQGGKNLTTKDPTHLELKVTRNGQSEPFTVKVDDDEKQFLVKIGRADTYVQGRQVYQLEYLAEKVITSFTKADDTNQPFQELYWDTNGTGWKQPFQKLTAHFHLSPELKSQLQSNSWCYVGRYGANNQSRCHTTTTEDGFTFTTENLTPYENLTFVTRFQPDSFHIPPRPKDYIFVVVIAIELVLIIISLYFFYFKAKKSVQSKIDWYKTAPVPPQYSPLKNYSVGEMAKLYLKSTANSKVATLLELIVQKKVTLIKNSEGKKSWSFSLQELLQNLSQEQRDVINILSGNETPTLGVIYPIAKPETNSSIYKIFSTYDRHIESSLRQKGDLISSTRLDKQKFSFLDLPVILTALLTPLVIWRLFFPDFDIQPVHFLSDYAEIVFPELGFFCFALPFSASFLISLLTQKLHLYHQRTMQGLEHSNYLEGLKLYISMAETDRLKFLQSVNGADTSPAGIVHLYEKLLPYAALFKLEKSWMAELEKYYQLEEIEQPDWYSRDLTAAIATHTFVRNFSSYSYGGGSSSSSSSGGGGGGFSGGGGGGGGGGGW
ncbi:MAG: DUF2207 domain-containing protein [Candidatus Saccharibacteria bacterium]|nr:DUF2207 domain-containing protein [Candidatus Saccharibacteria bacterium]